MKSNYIKPYRFKIFTFLLTLVFFSPSLQGQVTIGEGIPPQDYSILEVVSNGTGGLRLPQLSSKQRNDLEMGKIINGEKKTKAIGLTIMNTDNGCYEYWNGTEWISLCEGQSDIGFIDENGNNVDPTRPAFPCKGGSRGPFTPKEGKQCVGISTPYTYAIVSGTGMLNFQVTDPAAGKFTVSASENPTARMRTAIVRVTNNCTGKHRDLLFTQEGCDDLCRFDVSKPAVNVSNNGQLCLNGAVYMYITNPSNDVNVNYIWTLNDVEMGRGVWYAATTPGNYIVYVNAIGCDANASDRIKVTYGDKDAPPGNMVIQASNNGVVCKNNIIRMMAYNVPASGRLTWYKNGIKTTKTGNPIILTPTDIGIWFAVMEDGSCTSRPSNSIHVTYINVNGTPVTSISSLCKSGRLDLELANHDYYYNVHQVAVTISWYNGLTYLGEGPTLSVVAPSSGDLILRCVVSDNTGSFCSSEMIKIMTLSGNAPNVPGISGVPYICGGVPTSLTAMVSGSGSYTYEWYKDGQLLSYKGQTLLVGEIGTYRVAVKEGACISDKSMPVTVSLSDFPALKWSAGTDTSKPGQVHTYLVEGFYNPTKYTWIVNNGATVENGQGTRAATIRFPNATTTVNIKVTADNHCGQSLPLARTVAVKPAGTAPIIRSVTMNPTGQMLAGGTLSMSASATGTDPITYQWKRNGADIAGATAATYTVGNATTSHSGTYSVTASNPFGSTSPMVAGSVTVINMGSIPNGNGKLTGENCFDIAVSNDNTDCGKLALRQPYKADFSKTYTYTFTNSGTNNNNLQFIIDDPEGAVENYTVQQNIPNPMADGGKYTLTVKYKQSLMQTAIGRTNDNPIKVTIYALYKAGATQNKSALEITIKDCDCCSAVMDMEGNAYTAHRFGDAGCWMTQNLRSTYNSVMPKGTILQNSNSESNRTAKYYHYPNIDTSILDSNPEYGLLYTWHAASGGAYSDQFDATGVGKGTVKSNVQGICPDGWVLPSDFDWNTLEKEITENAVKYSNAPNSKWNTSWPDWESTTGFRGSHGQAMKSPVPVDGKAIGGLSNTIGAGWNGLIVGNIKSGRTSGFGTTTNWWSSTSYTIVSSLYKGLSISQPGVFRSGFFNDFLISVRCKKAE